jgi:short-subunit dehydrogenase
MAREFKPVILITGCSSGIGLALVERLLQVEDYRIVATARETALIRLKMRFPINERLWLAALDVRSAQQRKRLIDEIEGRWGGVDILINNAGISYRSVVEHMTDQDEKQQLLTNYLGPMALIRLTLPSMREKGRGKIINISSVSGMLAMPTMASYSASKHALEGASEALWYEVRPFGINVTLLQPGFIRSQSFINVYYSDESKKAEEAQGAYSRFYRSMSPFITNMMNRSLTTPEKVAEKVLKIIRTQNPPLRVPATIDAIVFYYLRRWIPRRFFHPFLFRCLPGAKLWGKEYSNARPSPTLLQRLQKIGKKSA